MLPVRSRDWADAGSAPAATIAARANAAERYLLALAKFFIVHLPLLAIGPRLRASRTQLPAAPPLFLRCDRQCGSIRERIGNSLCGRSEQSALIASGTSCSTVSSS